MRIPRKLKKKGMVTFEDNKGRRIRLPAQATIHDLVKYYGITGIRLGKPGEPIADLWWRDVGELSA